MIERTDIEQAKRNNAYEEFMKDFMQGYYDTKRDEDGMADFVKLLNLGCFGKEFCTYGVAYEDKEGHAYRVSGKAVNLHEFVKYSGINGIYPTPVICNYQRRIAPSGAEDFIKSVLKKETAEFLKETYNETYFAAMRQLGGIPANDSGYPMLDEMRSYLEGRYIKSELDLYEGLLLETFNAKKLTLQSYMEFAAWLKDVRKQMENDILEKTPYEKILSGFSYIDKYGNRKYFTDAYLQTTYERREEFELEGLTVTPVYVKKYWLKDMNKFLQTKKAFEEHIRECFDEHYWALFHQIHSLPCAVEQEQFREQAEIVRENCSEKAYLNLMRYGHRWGAVE